MRGEQSAQPLQQIRGWRFAQLGDHAFHLAMLLDQARDRRILCQRALDGGKKNGLLDLEVIREFQFVAVDGAARKPLHVCLGRVFTKRPAGEHAHGERIVVPMR